MRMLITNDDGVLAPGLVALVAACRKAGNDVVVAAPAEQSSGASAAITADRREGNTPVKRVELDGLPELPAFAVAAQPAHIVLAAVRGWLDPPPDLVLSGINHGANVGRVVLHSGTVGAALTAGVHGVRALAISLNVPDGLPAEPGRLRHADLAPFGIVPTRFDIRQRPLARRGDRDRRAARAPRGRRPARRRSPHDHPAPTRAGRPGPGSCRAAGLRLIMPVASGISRDSVWAGPGLGRRDMNTSLRAAATSTPVEPPGWKWQ